MTNMNVKAKDFLKNYKRHLFIAGGLLLAVIFAAAVLLGGGRSDPAVVQTAQVERGAITETVEAIGVVAAMPSASITWKSGGIVSSSTLKVGDQVKKGEILFTLEDSSISSEILQARSSLLEAQAEFEKMTSADTDFQAALEEVTLQESYLTNKYSMRHEFYGTNVSDERINTVYASYNKARAEVWKLEAAYEKVRGLDEKDSERTTAYDALQAGVLKRDSQLRLFSQVMGTPYGQRIEGYFIAYDQQVAVVAEAWAGYQRLLDDSDEISAAQANLQALQNTVDQASIIAPFSGTITAINSLPGNLVSSGDVAVQLDDLSNLTVDIDVSQMDVNKISIGQPAELTFDAIPNAVYSGIVIEISEAGSASNEDAVFKVRVALTNPDDSIKPGFSTTVSIITDQVDNALLVPNIAIQYDKDGSTYVKEAAGLGEFISVPIETGARSDAFTELVSGDLEEGDRLAVAQVEETSAQLRMGLGRIIRNR
jgi:HlyD family secretion protein